MGFEQKINYRLNKYPFVKRIVKRAYQGLCRALLPSVKSEGDIARVSPDDPAHEYFFGYYDKSPEDATGRYALCLRVENAWRSVAPSTPADILLIDTAMAPDDPRRVRVLARTNTWNVQQGAMMQWLGPDFDREIIYNDCLDGRFCAVVLDVFTGASRVLPMPVYTVSADGRFALTLDFARLHRLRPGYGYANLPESTAGEKLPDAPCIWRMDLESGAAAPILKYADFANFEPRPDMRGAVHKVNHLMLSPDGSRFMVLHRWLNGSRKYTRLVTANVDGSGMYNLSDDDFVSHCCWRDSETILAFENKRNGGPGYYLMKDRTAEYARLWPDVNADGHPSYSPDGASIVTDTYPDKRRLASIRVMREGDASGVYTRRLARVFAPFRYDNDLRCDLHPRWSRDGSMIYFDAVYEGRRRLYRVPVPRAERAALPERPLVSCVIPTYKRSDMLPRAVDSVLRQTYGNVEVVIVDDNEPGDEFSLATERQLERYRGNDRVRFLRQAKHINGAAARNFGIRHARGEYVAFLDDDDEWLPEKLERQMAWLLAHPEDGGATCLYCCTLGDRIVRRCPPYTGDDLQLKVLLRQVSLFTSTFIARKAVLEASGAFDEKLQRHQDLQLFVDFLNHAPIHPVEECLVVLHTDSQANKPDLQKLAAVKKAFFESVSDTLAKYDPPTLKRIRNAHQFEMLFAALKAKNYVAAIGCLIRIGFSPRAYRDVLQRWLDRK